MCDPNPSPVDDKWYSTAEAQERQKQLVKTMPTGTNWSWVNHNGNEVVFS